MLALSKQTIPIFCVFLLHVLSVQALTQTVTSTQIFYQTHIPCSGHRPGYLVCASNGKAFGLCREDGYALQQDLAVGDGRCLSALNSGVGMNGSGGGSGEERSRSTSVVVVPGRTVTAGVGTTVSTSAGGRSGGGAGPAGPGSSAAGSSAAVVSTVGNASGSRSESAMVTSTTAQSVPAKTTKTSSGTDGQKYTTLWSEAIGGKFTIVTIPVPAGGLKMTSLDVYTMNGELMTATYYFSKK